MNEKEITLAILALGQARIIGAFKQFLPSEAIPAVNPNGTCAKALAKCVVDGKLTLSDIKSAAPHVAPVGATVDPAVIDAVSAVAGRAESVSLDAMNNSAKAIDSANRAVKIADDVSKNVGVALNEMLERIQAETTRSISVDPAIVRDAVAGLIDGEFAKFRKLVVENKAEEIVADHSAIRIVDRKSALDVFGFDIKDRAGNPVMVDIWNHPAAPAIDPNWVWTEKILRAILTVQGTHDNLFFGGLKGTGKSQTAQQFAAFTGRAFTRFQFTKYTTAMDIMGQTAMKDGNTVFEKGAVLDGLTTPSTVVLLDEISMADAGELAILNGFLEPNPAISYGGQVHRRADGVIVFGADNTLTQGDESGMYSGTRRLNTATAERFASVIKFENMSADMEIDIVVKRTGCSKNLARHVVKALNAFRAKVEKGDIIDAPSIRQTIYFIKNLRLMTVDDAWNAAIGNRQPVESAVAVEAIKTAYINNEQIDKLA